MKMHKALRELDTTDGDTVIPDKYAIMEGAIKQYCKLKKKGRTHRSVLGRNSRDILDIEASIPLDATSNRKNYGNTHIKHVKEELIGKLLDKMNAM